jgi:murein DD-endopeptidase MepM/ murein hydrolase activator NlpD
MRRLPTLIFSLVLLLLAAATPALAARQDVPGYGGTGYYDGGGSGGASSGPGGTTAGTGGTAGTGPPAGNPTTTTTTTTTPTPTPTPTPKPAGTRGASVNPFAGSAWAPGRIDMGMDWAPLQRTPVLAVGNAVVLGSSSHSGWPGGRFIWYQLVDGSHAGDVIYVAEHLRSLARAGTHVRAGQRIATAIPGYPYIETGWADSYGSPRASPCYKEGHKTNSGKEMERFLVALGAEAGEAVAAGPNGPAGKLC